jgi:hypothetical protein
MVCLLWIVAVLLKRRYFLDESRSFTSHGAVAGWADRNIALIIFVLGVLDQLRFLFDYDVLLTIIIYVLQTIKPCHTLLSTIRCGQNL